MTDNIREINLQGLDNLCYSFLIDGAEHHAPITLHEAAYTLEMWRREDDVLADHTAGITPEEFRDTWNSCWQYFRHNILDKVCHTIALNTSADDLVNMWNECSAMSGGELPTIDPARGAEDDAQIGYNTLAMYLLKWTWIPSWWRVANKALLDLVAEYDSNYPGDSEDRETAIYCRDTYIRNTI